MLAKCLQLTYDNPMTHAHAVRRIKCLPDNMTPDNMTFAYYDRFLATKKDLLRLKIIG